jgi:O-antigen/teichoic acid export membrane protein
MSTLRLSAVGLTLRVGLLVVVVTNALILARVLRPEGFGEYFLFLRLVAVLAAFADFGLSQSVNAFYGRHKHWRGHIHNLMLQLVPIFSVAASCVAGLVLWLGGRWLLPNLSILLMFMAFAILPLSLYANLWNSMMVGTTQIWRVNLLQLVMCTFSLSLTIVFVVILAGGVRTAAINYLVVMFVQFVVMLAMGIRLSKDQPSSESPVDLRRKMMSFGLRAYPGSIGYLLCMRIPVFIINVTHGPAAVGIFSVAQQVAEKLLLPVEAIQDVTYEKMSTLSSAVAAKAMNLYLRLTWWGMWGIIILASVFSYLGIVLLLGSAYLQAISVAHLLFIGSAFAAVSLLMDTFFVNQLHRPGLVSILAWLKFLFALTLGLILIPPFGVKGAAASLATMQIVGAAVYVYLYLRVTKSDWKDLVYIRRHDLALLRKQITSLTLSAPAAATRVEPAAVTSETSY